MAMLKERDACDHCYGSGWQQHDAQDKRVPCYRCKGTGRQLTELGRELVEFLNEHYVLAPKAD